MSYILIYYLPESLYQIITLYEGVCVCVCAFSDVCLFATPWTVALQAPLSMEFSRQEYQNGLPFPTPEDLPDPGIEPVCPTLTGVSFISAPSGRVFQSICGIEERTKLHSPNSMKY